MREEGRLRGTHTYHQGGEQATLCGACHPQASSDFLIPIRLLPPLNRLGADAKLSTVCDNLLCIPVFAEDEVLEAALPLFFDNSTGACTFRRVSQVPLQLLSLPGLVLRILNVLYWSIPRRPWDDPRRKVLQDAARLGPYLGQRF